MPSASSKGSLSLSKARAAQPEKQMGPLARRPAQLVEHAAQHVDYQLVDDLDRARSGMRIGHRGALCCEGGRKSDSAERA